MAESDVIMVTEPMTPATAPALQVQPVTKMRIMRELKGVPKEAHLEVLLGVAGMCEFPNHIPATNEDGALAAIAKYIPSAPIATPLPQEIRDFFRIALDIYGPASASTSVSNATNTTGRSYW